MSSFTMSSASSSPSPSPSPSATARQLMHRREQVATVVVIVGLFLALVLTAEIVRFLPTTPPAPESALSTESGPSASPASTRSPSGENTP